MKKIKINFFPWQFYQKLLLLFLACLMVVAIALIQFSSYLPIIIATVLIFLSVRLFYLLAPISRLNYFSEKFHDRFSHEEKIRLHYKKSFWDRFEYMLDEIESQLDSQKQELSSEENEKLILLETIEDEIVAIDAQDCIIFANKNFNSTFNLNQERLQNRGKLWAILPDKEIIQAFHQCLHHHSALELKSVTLKTAHGERSFSIKMSPIINQSAPIGVVAVFRDITEAKKTEQMRVDFVANVSHELRTPLTSLMGYSQLLIENKAKIPNDLHPFLESILNNSKRMLSLFNDLLDLSVIESKTALEVEKTELSELIQNAFISVQGIYPDKKSELKLHLNIQDLNIEPKLFEQVFLNLFDNTFKYSQAPIVLEVSSFLQHRLICLKIQDNGPGIPREHQGRIFERFYRLDHSRDRSKGGTGLGLSIVKHIIQKHQGRITVESDGQQGTTFLIELPKT